MKVIVSGDIIFEVIKESDYIAQDINELFFVGVLCMDRYGDFGFVPILFDSCLLQSTVYHLFSFTSLININKPCDIYE